MHNKRIHNYLYALIISLIAVSCSQQIEISKVEGHLIELKNYEASSELKEIIEPYKAKLDSEMDEVIGTSDVEMDTDKPEGLLGNFVADLLLETANSKYRGNKTIDFCIINNGGLRSIIPKGEITRKKIYELMPFENELVVITLPYSSINKMFEYLSSKGGAPISGFRLEIPERGKYIAKTEDNKSLEERNYKVLTSDYLADGGGRMDFFADSLKREVVGLKVREAIMEYIIAQTKEGEIISTKLDKRISYAK